MTMYLVDVRILLTNNTVHSLASQTHFRKKKEKDLVNCVYKLCPTRMQLAGWRTQISINALLNYLLRGKHTPWEVIAEAFL